MSEDLKSEWRYLYSEELPKFAKENNWPVHLDHCIARIIYDHVAQNKWDRVWQKPAIHNLLDAQLFQCIDVAKKLKQNDLSAHQLNQKSLRYRGKL